MENTNGSEDVMAARGGGGLWREEGGVEGTWWWDREGEGWGSEEDGDKEHEEWHLEFLFVTVI